MNAGISELLTLGIFAVVAGALFLRGMLKDLSPELKKKWILGIALGSGIIAFSIKILILVTFSSFPEPILELFPKQDYRQGYLARADTFDPTRVPALSGADYSGYLWQSLPVTAPAPLDNPSTPAKIALGKQLFFDKRLSLDNSLSCASCHEISPQKGGTDGQVFSTGYAGKKGGRNAPTVLNAAFQKVLFWDGRASSLEDQAKGPITNPVEMAMPSLEVVVEKLRKIPEYQVLFQSVFQQNPAITGDNIAKAIAAFERTLITPNSAYDRFVAGDTTALNQQQIRGMELFESTGCVFCHSGPNFSGASIYTDGSVYRTFPSVTGSQLAQKYQLINDLGLAGGSKGNQGIWRIPSLRNINRTGPYFHNGSVTELKEVVRIMAQLQLGKMISNSIKDDKKIRWSPKTKTLQVSSNQAISESEIDDIVAFLKALDGELPKI